MPETIKCDVVIAGMGVAGLYCALNLLGSHDRVRLLTMLGNAPEQDSLSDAERAAFRLNEGQRSLAKGRLWLATLVQMTMPGVPCIYYGDEAGLEGYADPYNRGTYPWGHEDADCATIYHNAINLRKSLPLFVDGGFRAFACGKDVFGFVRTAAPGQDAASARRARGRRRYRSGQHLRASHTQKRPSRPAMARCGPERARLCASVAAEKSFCVRWSMPLLSPKIRAGRIALP